MRVQIRDDLLFCALAVHLGYTPDFDHQGWHASGVPNNPITFYKSTDRHACCVWLCARGWRVAVRSVTDIVWPKAEPGHFFSDLKKALEHGKFQLELTAAA